MGAQATNQPERRLARGWSGGGPTEALTMRKKNECLKGKRPMTTAQTLALAVALTTCAQLGFGQSASEYHRTLQVTVADPVTLDVHLSEGDLQIAYGRDEQVSIVAIARVP